MLKRICDLLQSPDNLRRCAGAITLAQLAPRDSAVVKALGQAAQHANPMLTGYILEALEAIGSPAAVPYVMPLLEAEDTEIKLRAAAIVSRGGRPAVAELRKRLRETVPSHKLMLADVLARMHTREAFESLLELLSDPDAALVAAVCEAVHRHLPSSAPAARAQMHRQVVHFMSGPAARSQERVFLASLLLLGHIGQPQARALLLKHAQPKHSVEVRRHALMGLRSLDLSGAAAKAVGREMLSYLDKLDETLVRHVLEVIARLPLPAVSGGLRGKLLKHPHPDVRAFAARKLAETDNAAANRELLALLRHEDGEVSEIAASALAGHTGATRLLLGALARESQTDAAWRLAKILKPHSGAVDAATRKRFQALASQRLAKDDPSHQALLYFLRNVNPKAADDVLRQAGLAHKRARRWARAVEELRRLVGTESFDDEVRYALSACNLKLSPKVLEPHLRAEDQALRGLQALRRSPAFKLLERMKKDPTFDAADLHYVGFHFSEGAGEEKQFGDGLLAHVARTWPRTEEGKAAKRRVQPEPPRAKSRAQPKATGRTRRSKTAPRR